MIHSSLFPKHGSICFKFRFLDPIPELLHPSVKRRVFTNPSSDSSAQIFWKPMLRGIFFLKQEFYMIILLVSQFSTLTSFAICFLWLLAYGISCFFLSKLLEPFFPGYHIFQLYLKIIILIKLYFGKNQLICFFPHTSLLTCVPIQGCRLQRHPLVYGK